MIGALAAFGALGGALLLSRSEEDDHAHGRQGLLRRAERRRRARHRELQEEERELAELLFGDSLDVDAVRLHLRPVLRPRAQATERGGHVAIQRKSGFLGPRNWSWLSRRFTPQGALTLAHELFHVWQEQQLGGPDALMERAWRGRTAGGDSFRSQYDWASLARSGVPWWDWNPEAQAEAFASWFGLKAAQEGLSAFWPRTAPHDWPDLMPELERMASAVRRGSYPAPSWDTPSAWDTAWPTFGAAGDQRYGMVIALPLVPMWMIYTVIGIAAAGVGVTVWDGLGRPLPELTWPGATAVAAAAAIPTPEDIELEKLRVKNAAQAAGLSIASQCAWALSPMLIADEAITLFSRHSHIQRGKLAEIVWRRWDLLKHKFTLDEFVQMLLKGGAGKVTMNLANQALVFLGMVFTSFIEAVIVELGLEAVGSQGLKTAWADTQRDLLGKLNACYQKNMLKATLSSHVKAFLKPLVRAFEVLKRFRTHWAVAAVSSHLGVEVFFDDKVSSLEFIQLFDVWSDIAEQYGPQAAIDGELSFQFIPAFAKAAKLTERILRGEAAQWKVGTNGMHAYLASDQELGFAYDDGSVPADQFLGLRYTLDGGKTWEDDPLQVRFAAPLEDGPWFYYQVEYDEASSRPRWFVIFKDGRKEPMALSSNKTFWEGTAAQPPQLEIIEDKPQYEHPVPPPPEGTTERKRPARAGQWAMWKDVSPDPELHVRLMNEDSGTFYDEGQVPAPAEYSVWTWDGDDWEEDSPGKTVLMLPGTDMEFAVEPGPGY